MVQIEVKNLHTMKHFKFLIEIDAEICFEMPKTRA